MNQLDRILSEFYDAVFDTDRIGALDAVERAVDEGISPEDIVFRVVLPTVERMLSELVDTRGATLSQHYICSRVAGEVTDMMIPQFRGGEEKRGCVVLGAARGDFHGLGKKIVAGCLKANMYEVYDLGINVKPEQFVEEALNYKADIIGVSSMMVHTTLGEEGPLKVVELLEERGLHERIAVIVGGAPYRFDSDLYRKVRADGWSENALEAVQVVDRLMRERLG